MQYGVEARLFKVLANPTRLGVLHALRSGERSVGELCRRLRVEQTSMSQHLSVLRASGFVVTDRRGPSVYYAIGDPGVVDLLRCAGHVARGRGAAARALRRAAARKG
jgi:DNA-binding transcriptional ArsR family regulator